MSRNIAFATSEDIDEIMRFIHTHWKRNHILSTDKQLFLYDYGDIGSNRINFLISRDASENINGILGFIKSASSNSDIWAAMWKVVKSDKNPMLGIDLLETLRNEQDYGVLLCSGVDKKTLGIYDYLGIYTNHLKQFVLINNTIKQYNICLISNQKYLEKINYNNSYDEYLLHLVDESNLSFNFKEYNDNIPYKDRAYFLKRYYKHPIYEYQVYGISKNNKIHSLFVTRSVCVNNAKALRIVDFIGQDRDIKFVMKEIYEILYNNNYEYVDFMCFGFDYRALLESGFHQVDLNSLDLIVPNYFSPFLKENIKLNFFVDTNILDKIRIFLADGDQDRPTLSPAPSSK